MASDISLAVGDGARRMTYAELARAKGISLTSARQLVRRHHWPKQVGNDGYVKVTVPLAALTHVNTQDRDTGSDRGTSPSDTASRSKLPKTHETPNAVSPSGEAASDRGSDTVSETLSRAVDSLREQLGIANDRAERAERRIDELQAALADERAPVRRFRDRAKGAFREVAPGADAPPVGQRADGHAAGAGTVVATVVPMRKALRRVGSLLLRCWSLSPPFSPA